MNRQKEALQLAEELLADIELGRCTLEQCLLKSHRLARLMGTSQWDSFVNFELYGYDSSEESYKYMDMTGRWTDKADNKGHWASLATLESFVGAHKAKLATMSSPSLSGDGVMGAMRSHLNSQNATADAITTSSGVISRVRAVLHRYISTAYFELAFSESQASLFESARLEIDSRILPISTSALDKVDSIIDRLNSGEVEAVSQAMNTCRRLIDSLSDSLQPPQAETIEIDGNKIKLGAQNHLNRLNFFISSRVQSKGRKDRLRRTLSDIYSRVSTGVHSEVSTDEARYLFLQTYIVLGEIIMLPEACESP